MGTVPSRGQLIARLEGLIIEAHQELKTFAEGRTLYFAYIEELRRKMQHCLADIGDQAQAELREITGINLNPSEGLRSYYDRRIFNDFEAPGDTEFVRLQKEHDSETPPKIQRMVMLLNQVRDKLLGVTPTAQVTRLIRPFHTPDGSSWADVLVRFTSDHQVQITVRDRSEVRNYVEMGFEDRRGRRLSKPDTNWERLRTFAAHDGTVGSTPTARDWRKLEKAVQTINTRLKALLGFGDPPIVYDRKAKSYRASFRLAAPPKNGDT